MGLIRILAMVVIVATVSSCGIFRKTKHKENHTIEEVSKQESVSVETSTTKGEAKERNVDKGKVVTERTTTSTTTKGGKSGITIRKGDLKPGENYLKDSAGNEVKAVLDTLGKTLTLELNTPPETNTTTTKERITENRDETRDREENQEQQQEKQVAIREEQRREESTSESISDSKPSPWAVVGNWVGIAVAVVIVLGFMLWYWGRKKPI